jgi:pimeloyl-ACP methyl ester carboxylesterase
MPSPELFWANEIGSPTAVALVLPGGHAHSRRGSSPLQPAVLRMIPFSRALVRVGDGLLGVARVGYAVRGWNGDDASPVGDARAALEQVAARHPGVPIGLLGHSMGGRVALRLADDPRVSALAALAPWVERTDLALGHQGLTALIMHGTRDRITSPSNSRRMAEAMAALGVDARWRPVEGEVHSLLRQPGLWHREAAEFLAAALLRPPAI